MTGATEPQPGPTAAGGPNNKTPSLSADGLQALRRLETTREVTTVILRLTRPGGLVLEKEGNLTHDELLRALPPDEMRLVVHELAFATREGARRHQRMVILWAPPAAAAQEQSYNETFAELKRFLTGAPVHLRAGRTDQLKYSELVALAG
ncbi:MULTISPECIES: hypothetical protein [unclassified Streptomyces]|uniref:hypothetical protein n=1 Tax=unclassified Streptomyces TaxID=2593676 RepID=UPI0036565E2C